ncbi:alpha/beta hydrolase [Streptomyces sp. S.PB5]|uniref:alpha/beta hydrolase fold domain-containing protein n=1 Tax=Streptomyces sp. S.PB5 TaxID=3020844 RepID=UPI0025B0049E|nr:alpha/beta hydrolase [Streptomyces sp. S.PB5]MDN3027199.1 alpha/beta hydrolase [Streptomyces sp. S.PB5]
MFDFAPSAVRQPVLDLTTRAFVAQYSCPPSTHDPNIEQARRDLARLHGGRDLLGREATTDWLALSGGPTGHVRVQVVRLVDSVGAIPVVLFLHGLGRALRDACIHEHLVRAFVLGTDAAVVFVDYERTPAAQYPIAVEQCYAVAKWICERGGEIGLDGSRTAAEGDSADGNPVAALHPLAKEREGVRLIQQALLYPVTDADFETPFLPGVHQRLLPRPRDHALVLGPVPPRHAAARRSSARPASQWSRRDTTGRSTASWGSPRCATRTPPAPRSSRSSTPCTSPCTGNATDSSVLT